MAVVAGLERFSNQEVSCVAEGEYIGDFQVDNDGKILDFPDGFESLQFGFRYVGAALSNDVTYTNSGEGNQISKKRIDKAMLKMENSAFGRFGSEYENISPIQYDKFRNTRDIYTYANLVLFGVEVEKQIDSTIDQRSENAEFQFSDIELFTGDFITEFPQESDESIRWGLVQDQPYPLTLLALFLRGNTRIG